MFFHTNLDKTISIWTSLCVRGLCHAETGKGPFQIVATKLEAQNHLECQCIKICLHWN
uniref:Uncharacterized protein n=1 Tax=Anguilla anguilla TaxID=7936 RepID=A0A0E9SHC0_ANGAN